MPLLIGLGNIGREYEGSRHNIGFEIVDGIAEKLSAGFRPGRGPFEVAEGRFKGRKITLIKPATYMNLSGTAVKKALARYNTDVRDCLVIYDDLNLPLGKIRLREAGSAGGHNGIKDIIAKLGTDRFPRLRFGIGHDFAKGRQVDFVLTKFNPDEQELLAEAKIKALDAALSFANDGIERAMNYHN